MTLVTATVKTIEEYANAVLSKDIRSLFCNKGTRNEVAKELKKRGYRVKLSSTRGSTLHPEYVTDYVGAYETGFGNTDYNTHWSVLYSIEVTAKDGERRLTYLADHEGA